MIKINQTLGPELLVLPQLLGVTCRFGISPAICSQERAGQEGHIPVTPYPKLMKLSMIGSFIFQNTSQALIG